MIQIKQMTMESLKKYILSNYAKDMGYLIVEYTDSKSSSLADIQITSMSDIDAFLFMVERNYDENLVSKTNKNISITRYELASNINIETKDNS